jgi:hypothetical protein
MTPDNLVSRWTQQLEAFARVNAMVDGAKLVNDFLLDFRSLELAKEERILTLKAAAEESGYSVEHLARLIRQGRVANAGRRNAPRIRAADLPVRRSLARNLAGSYNVDTDARTLRNGRQ